MQNEFRFEVGEVYNTVCILSREGDKCVCRMLDDLSGHTSDWSVAHITSWTDEQGNICEGFQLGGRRFFAMSDRMSEEKVEGFRNILAMLKKNKDAEKSEIYEDVIANTELYIKAWNRFKGVA